MVAILKRISWHIYSNIHKKTKYKYKDKKSNIMNSAYIWNDPI